jgi:hypothetical protein
MTKICKQADSHNSLTRTVNLSLATFEVPEGKEDCEITEYDDVTGWKKWQDSVFVQEFEDSVILAMASAPK